MNLLAFDTSTERASLALLYQGEVTQQHHLTRAQHALHILPSIHQLLADAGIGLNHLDGIVFGQGPGSFTGLRIACSIAKGLAAGQDLPLYPVSTLEAITNEVLFQHPTLRNDPILSVIDASMNELYWCFYWNDEMLKNAWEARVSDTQALASILASLIPKQPATPLIVAGVGFANYREKLLQAFNAMGEKIDQFIEIHPEASAMLRLISNASTPVEAVSAEKALPIYIRDQVVHI